MPAATSTQHLAQQVYDSFESATRTDGKSSYYRIKDGSPEWITTVVREAHGTDIFPDDYRFEWIMDAAGEIAATDEDLLDDLVYDFADRTDIYTTNLTAWLASHLARVGYCDEYLSEFGQERSDLDTNNLLMGGQYMERMEIIQGLRSALESVSAGEDS